MKCLIKHDWQVTNEAIKHDDYYSAVSYYVKLSSLDERVRGMFEKIEVKYPNVNYPSYSASKGYSGDKNKVWAMVFSQPEFRTPKWR